MLMFNEQFTKCKAKNYVQKDETSNAKEVIRDNKANKINSFYYIHEESVVFSLLYQILKFDLIKGQTLIVGQSEDFSFKIKIFLERSGLDKTIKSCTKSNPIDYKNYQISLYNSQQANIFVTD